MVFFPALALLAAAIIPAASAPKQTATAEPQATAMVRILPGAALHFAEIEKTAPERLRDTTIRAPLGTSEAARLVEFQ
jgi:hypothetical protein